MACTLQASVSLSTVPESTLCSPLSVHGVVLFALPSSVVHVDAAEYVAWMSSRIDSLSAQLSQVRNVSRRPVDNSPFQSSRANATRHTLPPRKPSSSRDDTFVLDTPTSRCSDRLSLQDITSRPHMDDELPQSSTFFELRKQQLLKRIFDRAADVAPKRSTSVNIARRSISMDILRRRRSHSQSGSIAGSTIGSTLSCTTARSAITIDTADTSSSDASPMSGVSPASGSSPIQTATKSSPTSPLPPLVYPKPTRWLNPDTEVKAPRNSGKLELPAMFHAKEYDDECGKQDEEKHHFSDRLERGKVCRMQSCNNSLQSMSDNEFEPRVLRSHSDASRVYKPQPRRLGYMLRNSISKGTVLSRQRPDVSHNESSNQQLPRADPQLRFDALHCALRMTNPSYTIELPVITNSPSKSNSDTDEQGVGNPVEGTRCSFGGGGRRSLSVGDARLSRGTNKGELPLNEKLRERNNSNRSSTEGGRSRCDTTIGLTRANSIVGYQEWQRAGAVESDVGLGAMGRMNSKMRKSLRKVRRKESSLRATFAVDDDCPVSRTVSTSAIPGNLKRSSSVSSKKPFRTYTAWRRADSVEPKESKIKRFASKFLLRQARAPYQPV